VKFVTFVADGKERLGVWSEPQGILDLSAAAQSLLGRTLPADMVSFIAAEPDALKSAREVLAAALKSPQAKWYGAEGTQLLAPLPHPRKNVFCVGRNYKAHIIEGARARGQEPTFPPVPEFFTKPPTTIIGNDDEVHLDTRYTQKLDYEIELAIVIGKRCRDLTADSATGAIFGYTIVNDISARDAQQAHGQWFKGKGFDTYCPMGPCIVTADEFGDPSGHRLVLTVNGETRQDSNTSDLLFGVPEIVRSLAGGMTLEPGDVIATGTPSGVALGMTPQKWLQDGDVIVADIEGIGKLRNRVRKTF
jgi:2-keto-4-pentenoate hydratase/2-oxohepta-3-ene-1,7-dioic acid hydratase in catechol pathway